jgi:hypothetical protein
MDPKQNAAKSQSSKTGGSSTPRSGKKPKKADKNELSGTEETPVTMSGGSIIVAFDPPFDDEAAPGKKVKKVRYPGKRFTRVVIRKGVGGPVLSEFPPAGLELSKGCVIEIKAQAE